MFMTGHVTGPRSRHHRVASQPTMFMTGPRSRHQRRHVRDATDFYECMMIHGRIESPSIPVQGMHMKVFSKVYCEFVTGCIFCAPSGLRQGQVFTPAAASPPPPPTPVQMRVEGGGGGIGRPALREGVTAP